MKITLKDDLSGDYIENHQIIFTHNYFYIQKIDKKYNIFNDLSLVLICKSGKEIIFP